MFNFFRKKAIKMVLEDLKEPKPLPMGRQEFNEWSMRIISIAQIPGATIESQQFALAEMLLHVKPTQSFESDGHFVHSLRKGAVNQVAHMMVQELKKAQIERAEKEKIQEKQKETHVKSLASGQNVSKAKEENLRRLKGEVLPKAAEPGDKKVLDHHQV